MARPSTFSVIQMLMSDNAKAMKYLMSPRWKLHVPLENLCPSDTPSLETSSTIVKSLTVPTGVIVSLGKASSAA